MSINLIYKKIAYNLQQIEDDYSNFELLQSQKTVFNCDDSWFQKERQSIRVSRNFYKSHRSSTVFINMSVSQSSNYNVQGGVGVCVCVCLCACINYEA